MKNIEARDLILATAVTEPLDGSTQVGLQGLDLEMVMIAHQDAGMNP
jgi:hypothetical protein